jgi:hypothetical protein
MSELPSACWLGSKTGELDVLLVPGKHFPIPRRKSTPPFQSTVHKSLTCGSTAQAFGGSSQRSCAAVISDDAVFAGHADSAAPVAESLLGVVAVMLLLGCGG